MTQLGPGREVRNRASQDTTPQDRASQVMQIDPKWQALAIALLLPKVTATLLDQIHKELEAVSTLQKGFAEATLASGNAEIAGAKVVETATIVSAPVTLGASAILQKANGPSEEATGLEEQHKNLQEELAGRPVASRVGEGAFTPRPNREIVADLKDVEQKRDLEGHKLAMRAQIPTQGASAIGQIVTAGAKVEDAHQQMRSKSEQAVGSIYNAEAGYVKELETQAVQTIDTFRSVRPYEAQAALIRG